MRLLLDTHLIVWLPLGDQRLTKVVIDAVGSPDNSLHVSPVTAFELTELQRRGRIEVSESISELAVLIGFELADLPADLWRVARELPDIHRDPVDRMLIAHAMAAEFTLVTVDKVIRSYPVRTLW